MVTQSHILGVILAGGSSRRMGGGDKGLADLDGRPMLAHVIERFRTQTATLVLNANGDPARFESYGLPVIPDRDRKEQGPMAGLIAAMHWAERSNPAISAVATVTSDVPFLPLDLVARLVAESQGGLAIAVSAERRHPTIGLWPLTLREKLQAALARDELSLGVFAQAHEAIAVSFPFSESVGAQSTGVLIDPFFNANTPDDLKEARALLTRRG
jgi:molybdenum cofactor guanylyltransferase